MKMNIRNILLTSMLMLGAFSASAQDQQGKTENVFQPHWYVMVQPLGGQYTMGEVDFGDLLSYNAQLGVGYNFNPYIGLRLSLNAWQSKGDYDIDDVQYEWKWKYVSPMIDLTVNLSNLVCGYNPNRFFNLSALVGAGVNIAWDNDEAAVQKTRCEVELPAGTQYVDGFRPFAYLWDGTKTRFTARAGLMAEFRLSDWVSLNVEAQANGTSDRYNSKKADNIDWYFNALAGVKINLGKTHTTRVIPVPEPEIRYVDRVVEKVVEKQIPCPEAEQKPAAVEKEPLRRDIFFTISSVRIDNSEKQKIMDVVNYLNKYPEAKVKVDGYADKGTGNQKINNRLSQNRANTVVNELVNKYGIARNRIISNYHGDREQPFSVNEQNRVSICIAE